MDILNRAFLNPQLPVVFARGVQARPRRGAKRLPLFRREQEEPSRRASQKVNEQQGFNRGTSMSALGGHQIVEDVRLACEATAERLQKVASIMAFEFAP